jgi:tetratricopeptide (TPR) repeat protein
LTVARFYHQAKSASNLEMKTLILITALLFTLVGSAATQESAHLLANAMALYQKGEVDEAVKMLELSIAVDSTSVDAYLSLAQILLANGQPARAETILTIAKRFTLANPQLHHALGIAHFEQKHYKKAANELERVLELQPRHEEAVRILSLAFLNLGISAYHGGETERAVDYFHRAVQADPQNAACYKNLAVLHRERAEWEKAKRMLNTGLELAPDDREMLAMLIQIHQQLKEFEEAELIAQTLYRYYPDDIEAALQLAYLYRFNNQGDRAVEIYRDLLETFPKDRRSYDEFADLCVLRARYDLAVELYEKLLSEDPERREVYEDIADIYIEAEEYTKAKEALHKALEGSGNDIDIYHKSADICMLENDWHGAESVYLEALSNDPDDASLIQALGRLYEEFSPEKAIRFYRRTIRSEPTRDYSYIRLGSVYSRLDSMDLAVDCFRKAVEMNTADPLPYHRLAARTENRASAVDYEHSAVLKALQSLEQFRNKSMDHMSTFQGAIDVAELDAADKRVQEIEEIRDVLRQSLADLLKLERTDYLESDLIQWWETYPDEPIVPEYLGLLYERSGKTQLALDTYQRLVRQHVKNEAGHLGIARLYEMRGEKNEAILAYKRARTLDRKNPEIHDRLARLYCDQNRITELIDYWLIRTRSEYDNIALLQTLLGLLQREDRKGDLAYVQALMEKAGEHPDRQE